ncbi:MAG: hypothetical protein ACK5JT_24120, partial [Hyphomicrobiaceae bacterium]
MPDTERKTNEHTDHGKGSPQSEELDAILKRIANHISEVERRHGDGSQPEGETAAEAPAADAPDEPPVAEAPPPRHSIRKRDVSEVIREQQNAQKAANAAKEHEADEPSEPYSLVD